jgi:hypothetical protein
MLASGENLSFYQGDTFTKYLTVLDENGSPVNLLNYSGYAPAFYRYGYDNPNFRMYVSVYEPNSGILKLTSYGASTTGVPAGRMNYQVRLYSPANTSYISHYGNLDLKPGNLSLGGIDDVPFATGATSYSEKVAVETGVYYQAIVFPEAFGAIPCLFTQLEVPDIDGTSWYFVGVSGASQTGFYATYGAPVEETGYNLNVLAQNCSSL